MLEAIQLQRAFKAFGKRFRGRRAKTVYCLSVPLPWLLTLNHCYDRWRHWRGKETFSLSRKIKAQVKATANYVSRFENEMVKLAARRGCTGVICGHIHTPADRRVETYHYLNSGDWVESLTAIVEHLDGRLELLDYLEFCERWADLADETLDLPRPRFNASMIDL